MKKILLVTLAGASIVACSSKEVAQNVPFYGDRQVAEDGASAAENSPERKYFVVQNVATEKNRVYLKCQEAADKSCVPGSKNLLVFETTVVVGGDDKRTDVGVQNIERWTKFYQEGNGHYPSWYNPNYPPTPTGGWKSWFKKSAMPDSKGEMRGAFGWYTALMSPTQSGQWMHGTIGHGSDGDKFIQVAHGKGLVGFLGKLFTDMRSHGCTRHENRAIAYLQSILPAGTAVIKIYAKEGLADASLARYEGQKSPKVWNWTLTKEDVYSINQGVKPRSSDAAEVAARGVSADQIIEQGSYDVDQYPTIQAITGKGAESGKSGDSYKLFKKSPPQGLFLIDEGVVTQDYRHPAGIGVDGIGTFQNGAKLVPNYALQQ